MKLFIKNMVGFSYTEWLHSILDEFHIMYEKEIKLGELVLLSAIPDDKLFQLKNKLEEKGLSIIYDRKQIMAEQVKHVVFDMLSVENRPEEKYSFYISSRMHLNYTYLANIFSETQGITIEHFIIDQKIEKAKELLLYSDFSIGQITEMLHYSSIGHLSNQFKKVTGMNPTDFKKQQQKKAII